MKFLASTWQPFLLAESSSEATVTVTITPHYPSATWKVLLASVGVIKCSPSPRIKFPSRSHESSSLMTSINTNLNVFKRQSSSVATYRLLFELRRRFFVLRTHQNKLFSKPVLGPSWLNFINTRPSRHFLSSPQASSIHQALSIIESAWALVKWTVRDRWRQRPSILHELPHLGLFYAHNFKTSLAWWRHLSNWDFCTLFEH